MSNVVQLTEPRTRLDEHDCFYAALTARNTGLVDPDEQEGLRHSRLLVAGCGSIGGAVVEPLVRLGAEHLVLAEPDVYDLHNLNRQHATADDVGRNKAVVLAEQARTVNPYTEVVVDPRGVVPDNAEDLLTGVSVVFDGVDVTTQPALTCKYLLHATAHRLRIPVVSGYDIAGTQLVIVYDYRRRVQRILDGRCSRSPVEDLQPLEFLARVVPLRALPVEIFPVLRAQLSDPGTPMPQLAYSAMLYGAVAGRLALDLLAGRPVRHRMRIDLHHVTRPTPMRTRVTFARWIELTRLARVARRYRRSTVPAATSTRGQR